MAVWRGRSVSGLVAGASRARLSREEALSEQVHGARHAQLGRPPEPADRLVRVRLDAVAQVVHRPDLVHRLRVAGGGRLATRKGFASPLHPHKVVGLGPGDPSRLHVPRQGPHGRQSVGLVVVVQRFCRVLLHHVAVAQQESPGAGAYSQ